MKTISRWASRHVRFAVVLLGISEAGNAATGVLLGVNLPGSRPTGGLLLLMVGLLLLAAFLQQQSAHAAGRSYRASRRWLFGAFITNFLLFVALGGLWAASVPIPTNQPAWGSHRVTARADTLVQPTTPTTRQATNPDYYEDRRPVAATPVIATPAVKNQAVRRIGFVLLFLLGVVISIYSTALACNLACAGNGAAAVVVLLLGSGLFVAGFFMLSRALDKVIKPWRSMTTTERWRVRIRSLLLLLGFFALTTLLGQLTN